MNGKRAKELRKLVGYNPNNETTYRMQNTSKIEDVIVNGVKTPLFFAKCTVSVDLDNLRHKYKNVKTLYKLLKNKTKITQE